MVFKNDLDSHYLFSPVLVLIITLFNSVTTLFYQMPSSAQIISTDMQSAKWLGKGEHVLTL